ncbi:hypothetical protein GmHk_20G057500 [Glycine max]|nr:hypothetical protein GmHk_20G057500 [Glycine max]
MGSNQAHAFKKRFSSSQGQVSRARVKSEIEEVQEQMKVDMEAMKEQMTTMMEAMMSMRRMMEVNATTVVAASTATKVDPTHPPGFNQVQNKHSFLSYGLPPNYTPPNFAHTPDENVDNSTPMSIESQQPQSDHAHVSQTMGETHEAPRDHNLVDFEPYLGYAAEGQAFCGVPLPNTLGGPSVSPTTTTLAFWEYAQRWRDMAAQVAPLMMEREMITMIVDMLLVFYYEKMVGYMPSSFANLVFVDERIEVGMRRGKFDYPTLMNRKLGENGENKKEGGTHVVTVVPTWPNFPPAQQYQYSANISPSHYPPPYQPRTPNHPQRPPLNQPQNPPLAHPIPNTTLNLNQNTNQGRNFPEKKPVEFTPIPVSYANLLPYLLNNAIVAIIPAKVPQPPFSRGYNSNATCAYHGGVPGHFIEHCMTLKHKVQSLIDAD